MTFEGYPQEVEINIAQVFENVGKESAHNFRALRATTSLQGQGGANVLFEDMVITEDEEDALKQQLNFIVPSIYQDIRGYTDSYTIDTQYVTFEIKMKDANAAARVQPLLEAVVQHKLLAWWYEMRMPKLAEQYNANASNDMARIRSIVIPTFGVRKIRMI